jgi:MFS family permease
VTTDNQGLVQEAAASLSAAEAPTVVARALLLDRRRFLPYVALGGASVGTLAGALAGSAVPGAPDIEGSLVAGGAAGITTGMVVGWVVFGVAANVLAGTSPLGWRLTALRAVLSLPAHLVAGLAGALGAGWVSGGFDRIRDNIDSIVLALCVLDVVLLPIALAFARRRSPIVSTGLRDAIDETMTPPRSDETALSSLGVTAIAALVWFFIASFGVFAALSVARSISPSRYVAAFDSFGGPIGIAILVTWVATIVLGTRVTIGFLRRRFG